MEKFLCPKTIENISSLKNITTEATLSSIKEVCQTMIFQQQNIACLCDKIEPIAAYPPYKTIYALLPIEQQHYQHSLVLTEETFYQVEATNKKITESLIRDHLHAHPRLYRFALSSIFDQCKYKLSCSLPAYCLIPLGGVTEKKTIWVNPAQIAAISEEPHRTELILRNGFRIASELTRNSIHKGMLLGFLCQAIVKREWYHEPLQENLSLQEYLQFPGTREVNHVIRDFTITDIPGKRGELITYYREEMEIDFIRRLNEKEERLRKKHCCR